MSKKNIDTNPNAFDTLIGKNAVFTGKLESSGLTRIEGKVNGDIILDGNLFVGEDSMIQGNVKAVNVEIYGTVHGNIEAQDSLTLHETCRLVGDVHIKTFIVKSNASFEGNCKMKTPKSENTEIDKKKK